MVWSGASILLLGTFVVRWWQWWLYSLSDNLCCKYIGKEGLEWCSSRSHLLPLCAHNKWRERDCESLSHNLFSSLQMHWSCSLHCVVPSYNLVQGQGLLANVPGPPPLSFWVLNFTTFIKEHAFSFSKLPYLGDPWMPPKPLSVMTWIHLEISSTFNYTSYFGREEEGKKAECLEKNSFSLDCDIWIIYRGFEDYALF